jgi:hypothetical protein
VFKIYISSLLLAATANNHDGPGDHILTDNVYRAYRRGKLNPKESIALGSSLQIRRNMLGGRRGRDVWLRGDLWADYLRIAFCANLLGKSVEWVASRVNTKI